MWCKGSDSLWFLGQNHSADLIATDTYIVRYIDGPGPLQLKLRPELYITSPSAPRRYRCLRQIKFEGFRRKIQRNVNRTHDFHAPLQAFVQPPAFDPRYLSLSHSSTVQKLPLISPFKPNKFQDTNSLHHQSTSEASLERNKRAESGARLEHPYPRLPEL